MKRTLISILCLSLGLSAFAASEVESYTYSPKVEVSQKYAMKVNGIPVTVLQDVEPDFAIFGAKGEVNVEITLLQGTMDSLIVRPQAKGYKYSFKDNKIHLKLKTGDRVSVEPNHSTDKSLLIFVNPLEAKLIKKLENNPKVRMFKAGEIYEEGHIKLKDGETFYIQGGAIVKGFIGMMKAPQTTAITIDGGGILDNREWDGIHHEKRNPVRIDNSDGLVVENITVLNQDYWTFYTVNCDDCLIRNVKLIGTFTHKPDGTGNEDDGFDICSSHHVTVEGCFAYAHDDAFCVKSSTPTLTRLAKDIHFKDCVAWNVDSGNSFEIGYRVAGGVEDIYYEDIYAIHSGHRPGSHFRRSGLSIHQGSPGYIKNIHYKNVHIEDPQEFSININVFKTPYKTYEWAPGEISNVTIDGLHIYKKAPDGGVIKGFDAEHKTKNVVISNYYLEGKKVNSLEEADFSDTSFSEGIVIK